MPATPVNILGLPAPLYNAVRAEKARTGVPMCRLLAFAWDAYVAADPSRTAVAVAE